MDTTLTIDPGKAKCGWAVFEGQTLVNVGWHHALDVVNHIDVKKLDQLVMESQQIYKGSTPKDLARARACLSLALANGRVEGTLQHFDYRLKLYLPRQWKKSLNKDIFTSRIIKRMSVDDKKLFKEKMKDVPKSLRHNALDAIGLGIVHQKRW